MRRKEKKGVPKFFQQIFVATETKYFKHKLKTYAKQKLTFWHLTNCNALAS